MTLALVGLTLFGVTLALGGGSMLVAAVLTLFVQDTARRAE